MLIQDRKPFAVPLTIIGKHDEIVPYTYPKLYSGAPMLALVRCGEGGLWYPANYFADGLCKAAGVPYLSTEAIGHYKAIGIRFEAKVERGPQP